MNVNRLLICGMLGAFFDFVPMVFAATRDGKPAGKQTDKVGAKNEAKATAGKKPAVEPQPQSHEAVDDAVEADDTSLVTLGLIDGEVADGQASLNIRFDRKPEWQDPIAIESHGSFLQIAMPGVIVPNPGKFIDSGVVAVPKIATFQTTPTDAALRLFVAKDGAAVKDAMQAALLDKRLVLTIDLGKLDAPAMQEGEAAKSENSAAPRETAEAVIARTEVRESGPPPAELLQHGDAQSGVAAALGGFDLRGKLVSVTLFLGALLGFALLSWMLRPWIRRKVNGVPELPVNMRMLGSLPLASRQKLSLIQVGDEKILVGVTPEHVSFIASLPKQGGVGLPSGAAAPAMPTAQRAVARATDESGGFARLLGAREGTVEMAPAPKLKDMPGNDETSLRRPAAREAPPPRDVLSQQDRSAKAPAPRPARQRSDVPFSLHDDEHDSAEHVPSRFSETHDDRRTHAARPAAKPSARSAGSRVNISVGDDGARQVSAGTRPGRDGVRGGRKADTGPASPQAIDDVTKMIREKLKSLKSI